jgi:hypothetical protein
MNEITWHESAIWFFIAQKLLFANQYARKFHKIIKFSKNFKIIKLKKKIKVQSFFLKFQKFLKISIFF